MYSSQYYTCEQIDQRLLQGYLDDYNSQNNTNLTKAEFLALLFNTIGRNNTVDNLVTQIGYYECDTAGATAAKTITVANYALFAGGSMKVKFINKNTADNATLNINNQGAKALYYQGERASSTNYWDEGEVVEIYYDGTNYYANNVKGESGPTVLFSELDNFKNATLRDGSTPTRYTVIDNEINRRKMGTLDVISDGFNHVVTQIFTTHQTYDDATGTISVNEHHDDKVVCVYRSIKISGGTLPDTNWTRWNYINDEILKGIKGGLEYMSFKEGVFNVSLYNADGGTLVTYETLALALAAVPSKYQDGGMSIKFILRTNTGTNEKPVYKDEYVQYRLMKTAWSSAVGDWQGIDNEPTAGSENLVKSNGVTRSQFNKIPFSYDIGKCISVETGDTYSAASRACTDYVDISGIQNIIYSRTVTNSAGVGTGAGIAFYNSEKTFISGIKELINQPEAGYVLHKVAVPEGAVYARFTFWVNPKHGLFFFANANDTIAIKLYENIEYTYNNKTPNYDGVISVGDKSFEVKSKHELNRIYASFDGNANNNFVRSSLIFGLASNKFYRVKIKDTAYPSQATSGLAKFAVYAFVNEDSNPVELYRINGNNTIPSDIIFRTPIEVNSVFIGGRCNVGYTVECYIEEIELTNGYFNAICRESYLEGNSYKKRIVYNSNYGLNNRNIAVHKGDTLEWGYGNQPIRTINIGVFDVDGNELSWYNNNAESKRVITNFMGTTETEVETFYIEVPFSISIASDNYIKVNDELVWSGGDFNSRLCAIENVDVRAIDELLKDEENVAQIIDPTTYFVSGKYIDQYEQWHDGGSSYMFPVKEGDVFFIISVVLTTYYAFLENNDISGDAAIIGHRESYFSTTVWKKITIPAGATYLWISYDFGTTPHTFKIKGLFYNNNLDVKALQIGTFNSSYNEEDTKAIREKYCGILKGLNNIETFLFFSDPHLTDNDRYQTMTEFVRDSYISKLQKYYNSLPIDYCICGGDWLNFYHTDDEACGFLGYCDAYMRKLFKNYIPVFGNHDNNPYQDGNTSSSWVKALTYVDIRNLMFRKEKNTWYSVDGTNTKFYILNSGISFTKAMTDSTYSRLVDNRWPQVDWFANKLITDDSPHTVIVMHIFSNAGNPTNWYSTETGYHAHGIHEFGKNVKLVAESYNRRESITLNGINYNFSNKNGRVEFVLCGHTHFDFIDPIGDIPVVCITNLAGGYLVNDSLVTAKIPTFDNCICDYDNDRLYMVRVGIGVSRIVNYIKRDVTINGTISLSTQLSGIVEWSCRHTDIATVSDGVVSGISVGYTCVIAKSEDGTEEYWTIKVE